MRLYPSLFPLPRALWRRGFVSQAPVLESGRRLSGGGGRRAGNGASGANVDDRERERTSAREEIKRQLHRCVSPCFATPSSPSPLTSQIASPHFVPPCFASSHRVYSGVLSLLIPSPTFASSKTHAQGWCRRLARIHEVWRQTFCHTCVAVLCGGEHSVPSVASARRFLRRAQPGE